MCHFAHVYLVVNMLNRLGGQMVTFAGKTRALAEEALVALDAHDEDVQPPEPPMTVPEVDYEFLLHALLDALGGNPNAPVLSENIEVLVSQLNFSRDLAIQSGDAGLGAIARDGSIVEMLDYLLSDTAGNDRMTALFEALQAEQVEHAKTRKLLANVSVPVVESTVVQNCETADPGAVELASCQIELAKTRRMLEKLIREKSEWELEKSELVDSRIMKSLLISLGSQIDNKPVRDSVLGIAADILYLSPDEREKAGIGQPSHAAKPGLASAFLSFLEEEVTIPQKVAPSVIADI